MVRVSLAETGRIQNQGGSASEVRLAERIFLDASVSGDVNQFKGGASSERRLTFRAVEADRRSAEGPLAVSFRLSFAQASFRSRSDRVHGHNSLRFPEES